MECLKREDTTSKNIDMEKVYVDSLRHKRDRFESLINEKLEYIYFDPPWMAEQLAFTVYDQKDQLDGLISKIKNGFLIINNGFHEGINNGFHGGKKKKHQHIKYIQECTEDIKECTKELGIMIETDPRLVDLLERDFLELLVRLLGHERSPTLQAHAAIILKPVVTYSRNKDEIGVVIENITPIVLHLIRSRVNLVLEKALWLLRNLVFKISKSSIEEAVPLVTSIIFDEFDDYSDYHWLHPASEILIAVCQEHPKLSPEKLELIVQALMKLIESDIFLSQTAGCLGLARLCDAREEMIVEEKDLKPLIRRLVLFMNWEKRGAIIHGLFSLGSIVRWGSDTVIEAVIQDKGEEGSLHIFSILLEEHDMYIVKHVCWILSNITARKREHISGVLSGGIDGQLLNLVVRVVQTCTYPDIVKEALWAISNTMCGVGLDQIECLRNSCSKLCWDELLFSFRSDKLFVLVALEGLVNIKVAKVIWEGRQIDGVELHPIFKNIVHDSDLFDKYDIFSCDDNDNAQNSDGKVVHNLTFTFEDQSKDRDFCVSYDSLTKDLTTVLQVRF